MQVTVKSTLDIVFFRFLVVMVVVMVALIWVLIVF